MPASDPTPKRGRRSFRVAELDVELRAPTPDDLSALSGYYDLYPPSGGTPELIVDFRQVAGLAERPARSAYPGFDAEPTGPTSMRVWRKDATGTIECAADSAQPVRARFEVTSSAAIESAIRISMSVALPRVGGLILHASAVADGDRAHIFAGRSGAGKSTIADLLRTARPGLLKLSDDLLLVRPDDAGRWRVHVAPFHGAQGLPHGHDSSIASIHFIAHAQEHTRERLEPATALPLLLRHTLAYVADAATAQRTLDAAHRLTAEVDCFSLAFARDPGVAQVVLPVTNR